MFIQMTFEGSDIGKSTTQVEDYVSLYSFLMSKTNCCHSDLKMPKPFILHTSNSKAIV